MSRLPPNEDTFWEMWGEATLPCAPHADAQDTQLLRRKSPLTLSHRATVPASERLQEAEKEDTTGILGHSRRRERVEWPGVKGGGCAPREGASSSGKRLELEQPP